ncbi:MAG: TonB-dependent receptor [Kangiellaceae bacterium]|jgi:iron complex outermembrane receptor protein|nr:TonB-dependent receptor [Kangiellaceae bacterium]
MIKLGRDNNTSTKLLSLLGLCLTTPLAAYQQVSEDYFDLTFEELLQIEVEVATTRPEPIYQAPASVTRVTEQQWRKRAAVRSDEIVGYQPGVHVIDSFAGSNVYATRGDANSLSARGTATLIDGIPVNTYSFGTARYFLANIQLNALDSAELIRGPGSALYGSDAFHGVVSYQSYYSSRDNLEVGWRQGTQDYSEQFIRGSKIGEQHSMHFVLSQSEQGSFDLPFSVNDQSGIRQNAFDSSTTLLKLQSQWSDSTTTQIKYYQGEWDADDFSSFSEALLGINDVADNRSDYSIISADIATVISDNYKLDVNSYHWSTEQRFVYNFQTIPFQQINDSRTGLKTTLSDQDINNQINWLIGIEYQSSTVKDAQDSDNRQPFEQQEQQVKSLFGNVKWTIDTNDKWVLHASARLDNYNSFGNQLTPRLSLVHKANEQRIFKALYGNAFRAPTAAELTASGVILGNPLLHPEEIDTYELSWTEIFDNQLFTLTMFVTDIEDAILAVANDQLGGGFTQEYINIGSSRASGIELEWNGQWQHFNFDFSVAQMTELDQQPIDNTFAFPQRDVQIGIGLDISEFHSLYLYNKYMDDFSANTTASLAAIQH